MPVFEFEIRIEFLALVQNGIANVIEVYLRAATEQAVVPDLVKSLWQDDAAETDAGTPLPEVASSDRVASPVLRY